VDIKLRFDVSGTETLYQILELLDQIIADYPEEQRLAELGEKILDSLVAKMEEG